MHNQRSQIIFQYLSHNRKKKKEQGLRKRGVTIHHFPPPPDPRLYCSHAMLSHHSHTYTDMLILHLFFLLRSRTNHVARDQGNVAPNPELYRPKLYPCIDVYSSYYTRNFSKKLQLKSLRGMFEKTHAPLFAYCLTKKNQETVCSLICNYASSLSFTWK